MPTSKMKIFSIVGARPQFIKLAPLSAALSTHHQEFIVHTGQHYDYAMSQKFFDDLGIRKPDIHLETGAGNQTAQLAEMMIKLEAAMIEKKPGLIIVFGDTNSTLAGALVAAKLNIPILHIEAGLRSFNRSMPEEINRVITDHVSKYLFAPTQTAINNLQNEGLQDAAFLTGDIMVDTMQNSLAVALAKSTIADTLKLQKLPFNLLTLHRQYNVDDSSVLLHILAQLGRIEEKIIFPVHPRTKKMLPANFNVPANIQLIDPLGYLDFIALQYAAKRILTDSGGVQKEAYLLKKPCITLRSETEWVETVNENWNLLLHPSNNEMAEKIVSFKTPIVQQNVFGENVTAKMINLINKF
mgnify:CR=1 FL=1